jgi:hypothetical protein
MKITEINCETQEVNTRSLTQEEQLDKEKIAKDLQMEAKESIAQAEAIATQKAALLARLGITADEAKLLLG